MNKIELFTTDGKKIRVWIAHYDNQTLYVEYGVKDGVLVGQDKQIPKTKTPKQEAEFLANKKRNKGYVDDINLVTIDKVDNAGFPKFMLAQKQLHKISYPAFIQPKFNGVRALMTVREVEEGEGLFKIKRKKVIFRSKEGIDYHLPRISDWVERELGLDFFEHETGTLIFDGELYIHGQPVNRIKASCPFVINGNIHNPSGNPDNVSFIIFDVIVKDIPQKTRFSIIRSKALNSKLRKDVITSSNDIEKDNFLKRLLYKDPIIISTSRVTLSEDDAIKKASDYLALGFEGGIVRNAQGLYQQGKRSYSLCKIKFPETAIFKIINIIRKNTKEATAKFILQTDQGNSFESMPIGNYEKRHEYLKNKHKYIGKNAVVKYMEITSVDKVPFHSNVISIL